MGDTYLNDYDDVDSGLPLMLYDLISYLVDGWLLTNFGENLSLAFSAYIFTSD